jgi:SAM-dependent methyltransferase
VSLQYFGSKNMNTSAVEHYDQHYYETHYPRIWHDPRYYECQARHWRRAIFERNGIDTSLSVLDYGSGLGQVSAGLQRRACFDVSPEARDFMRSKGVRVFDKPADIPRGEFDAVLCSHTLEHHAEPLKSLQSFLEFVKPGGLLVLALPKEIHLGMALRPDSDRHFYAWTFQTVTNLLAHVGWTPFHQSMVHGTFLLQSLGVRMGLPLDTAVRLAGALGRMRGIYPTMLTLARKSS